MCKTLVIANMFLSCLSSPNGEATHMAEFPHDPDRKPVMVSIEGRPTSVGVIKEIDGKLYDYQIDTIYAHEYDKNEGVMQKYILGNIEKPVEIKLPNLNLVGGR